MNNISILSLKASRRLYTKMLGPKQVEYPACETDANLAAQAIYTRLMRDEPCMIARFGSTEMSMLCNYLGITREKGKVLSYIRGKSNPWWWEKGRMEQMQRWSGFFPPDEENLKRFCELMFEDMKIVDVLGSWLPEEKTFERELNGTYRVNLELLNPYFSKKPWTHALEGKKVLVVHPFVKSMQAQYQKRKLLFPNNLLPDFELYTVKAVQSLAGEKTPFKTWFDALDYMKAEIDKVDFDIALVGAGAYGFPLAAHVKRIGKKAIHIGGSLQLLFGIRGKRWENENYSPHFNYAKLINEHWIKPDGSEAITNKDVVEDACYW